MRAGRQCRKSTPFATLITICGKGPRVRVGGVVPLEKELACRCLRFSRLAGMTNDDGVTGSAASFGNSAKGSAGHLAGSGLRQPGLAALFFSAAGMSSLAATGGTTSSNINRSCAISCFSELPYEIPDILREPLILDGNSRRRKPGLRAVRPTNGEYIAPQ